MTAILSRLFLRRDTAAQWASVNPILSAGEAAFETNAGQMRIGDGATQFSSLPVFLAIPTAAITAAKAFLLATSAAAQRAVLGLQNGALTSLTGSLVFTVDGVAPAGTLKLNGAAISRTTYAALFAKLGTTWGAGDGATTFNLPDFRGEFGRFLDDGRGIDVGRTVAAWQAAAMLNHTHAVSLSTDGDHRHRINANAGGAVAILGSQSARVAGIGSAGSESFADSYGGGRIIENAGAHTHTATVGNPSAGGGSETRPRNVAMLACIYY